MKILDIQSLWHGTSKETNGEKILKSGTINPSNITSRSHLAPRPRVYMSHNLVYALIYAIGGDLFGHQIPQRFIDKDGRFGYLFEINPDEAGELDPDEDSVGEFFCRVFRDDNRSNTDRIVFNQIDRLITPNQRKRMLDGQYAYWAAGGKRALKYLSKESKQHIISSGGHVSAGKPVKWKRAYKIDKLQLPEISKSDPMKKLEMIATQ